MRKRIVLSPKEVRFEVSRGFQQIPRCHWRTFEGKNGEKAELSREAMIEIVAKRFDGLEVVREVDLEKMDFRNMGKGAKGDSPDGADGV